MSVSPDENVSVLATTAPSPLEKRDALGNFCFYLHFAVLIFIVSGWAIPVHAALYIYLAFLPLMVLTWIVNKNTCILNNAESYLRYGTWRSEQNAEEGAWLMTLIKNVTGIQLKPWQVDCITYGVMAMLWGLAFWHLWAW